MLFDEKIIVFDHSAQNSTQALSALADRLRDAGCVTDGFKAAILKRESQYPTGLQGVTAGVAIPHTDADKVIKPQIAFMRLRHPVRFLEIGDGAEVQVSLVFMLALKQSGDQLSMLQVLMDLFQNGPALNELQQVSTPAQFLRIMKDQGIISSQ